MVITLFFFISIVISTSSRVRYSRKGHVSTNFAYANTSSTPGDRDDVYAWTPSNGFLQGVHHFLQHDTSWAPLLYRTTAFYDIQYASVTRRFERAVPVASLLSEDEDHINAVRALDNAARHGKELGRSELSYIKSHTAVHSDRPPIVDIIGGIVGGEWGSSKCVQWMPHAKWTSDGVSGTSIPGLGGDSVGSEDCLHLDIVVPDGVVQGPVRVGKKHWALPHLLKPSPVIVFIHGGAFLIGDKFQNGLYNAEALAAQTGAIVVSINYRLSVLGWLAHPAQGSENLNLGLEDQKLALNWVKKNIHRFGGDPNRITLSGQSAGAMSVCAHLSDPGSDSLFQAAVLLSSNCDSMMFYSPRRRAEWQSVQYIRRVFVQMRDSAQSYQRSILKGVKNLSSYVPLGSFVGSLISSAGLGRYHALQDIGTSCANIVQDFVPGTLGYKEIDLAIELDRLLDFQEVSVNPGSKSYFGVETSELQATLDDESQMLLDQRLFECAKEPKMAKYVWINGMGLMQTLDMIDQAEQLPAFGGLETPLRWLYRANEGLGFGTFGAQLPWIPVIAPPFFEDAGHTSLPLFKLGRTARPIWVNWMEDEGSIFVPMLSWFFKHEGFSLTRALEPDVETFQAVFQKFACGDIPVDSCNAMLAEVTRLYNFSVDLDGVSRRLILEHALRDKMFVCPSVRIVKVAGGAVYFSTYRYKEGFIALDSAEIGVSLASSALKRVLYGSERKVAEQLGAFHMAELAAVFSWGGGIVPGLSSHFPPEMQTLSRAMSDAFVELRTPGGPWKHSTIEDMRMMIFDAEGRGGLGMVKFDSAKHHCDFWDRLQENDLQSFKVYSEPLK